MVKFGAAFAPSISSSLAAWPQRRAVQAQARAGRRGLGGGPPAGQGALGWHDRGVAGANDFGSALCLGLGLERCTAP